MATREVTRPPSGQPRASRLAPSFPAHAPTVFRALPSLLAGNSGVLKVFHSRLGARQCVLRAFQSRLGRIHWSSKLYRKAQKWTCYCRIHGETSRCSRASRRRRSFGAQAAAKREVIDVHSDSAAHRAAATPGRPSLKEPKSSQARDKLGINHVLCCRQWLEFRHRLVRRSNREDGQRNRPRSNKDEGRMT